MSSEPTWALASRLGGATPAGFGESLRHLRQQRRVSLRALARRINYDFGYIAQVERGERAGSADFAALCDEALQAEGRLREAFGRNARDPEPVREQPTAAHASSLAEQNLVLRLASTLDREEDDMLRRGFLVSSTLALGAALASPLEGLAPQAKLVSITGPSGRLFAGSAVPAMVLPAAAGEKVVVDIPLQRGIDRFGPVGD